jgi:hypothetical protein
VLARLVYLWRLLVTKGETWAAVRLRNDEECFAAASAVIAEHASLTEPGRLVIDSCQRLVDGAL